MSRPHSGWQLLEKWEEEHPDEELPYTVIDGIEQLPLFLAVER